MAAAGSGTGGASAGAGSGTGSAAAANPFAGRGQGVQDDPPSYEEVTATMNRMVDSITTLQIQMANLIEDPDVYMRRSGPVAVDGDPGPAVRERVWHIPKNLSVT